MKTTRTCPKCAGRKIWAIQSYRHECDCRGGRILPVSIDGSDQTIGAFDMLVCAGCGYSELWAKDFGALEHRPAAGVVLLDDATNTPYR